MENFEEMAKKMTLAEISYRLSLICKIIPKKFVYEPPSILSEATVRKPAIGEETELQDEQALDSSNHKKTNCDASNRTNARKETKQAKLQKKKELQEKKLRVLAEFKKTQEKFLRSLSVAELDKKDEQEKAELKLRKREMIKQAIRRGTISVPNSRLTQDEMEIEYQPSRPEEDASFKIKKRIKTKFNLAKVATTVWSKHIQAVKENRLAKGPSENVPISTIFDELEPTEEMELPPEPPKIIESVVQFAPVIAKPLPEPITLEPAKIELFPEIPEDVSSEEEAPKKKAKPKKAKKPKKKADAVEAPKEPHTMEPPQIVQEEPPLPPLEILYEAPVAEVKVVEPEPLPTPIPEPVPVKVLVAVVVKEPAPPELEPEPPKPQIPSIRAQTAPHLQEYLESARNKLKTLTTKKPPPKSAQPDDSLKERRKTIVFNHPKYKQMIPPDLEKEAEAEITPEKAAANLVWALMSGKDAQSVWQQSKRRRNKSNRKILVPRKSIITLDSEKGLKKFMNFGNHGSSDEVNLSIKKTILSNYH